MPSNGKKRSKYQEQLTAKKLSGEVVPFSGAGKMKGDVLTEDWFIECKSSALKAKDGAKSIYIQLDWLKKMELQRIAMNRQYAALGIHFINEQKDWFIISESMLMELINAK